MRYAESTATLHDWEYERAMQRQDAIESRADGLTSDELREDFEEAIVGHGFTEEIVWCLTEIGPALDELVSNGALGAAVRAMPNPGRAVAAMQELLKSLTWANNRRWEIALKVAERLLEEGSDA